MPRQVPPARPDTGSTSLLALFLALVLAGLSVGLVHESGAARAAVNRQETSFKALEIAEAGLCRAEVEIRALLDGGTDGIGNATGTYGEGTYEVKTVTDPVSPDRYVCTAKGTHGLSVRRIEVGLRRRSKSQFVEGLFSKNDMFLNGNERTDAYDSRLGTYASQAVNVDAGGTYALVGGDIGSNGEIVIVGTANDIRGNAIPGPDYTVDISGSATIYGDTIPREEEIPIESIPFETFEAAATTNDNGNWTVAGGSITWSATRCQMRVAAGTVFTLLGGTYFFSDFSLRAGAVMNIAGPCKIYTTGLFDIAGGSLVNLGAPADCLIYSAPYPLPTTYDPPRTEILLSGGTACAAAIYAPDVKVVVSGTADFFGAIVASDLVLNGDTYFHYDLALGQVEIKGGGAIERMYWKELSPLPR